jgi:hypothetical protein
MAKRRGDPLPDPPGGRAADRLGMFQEARGLKNLPSEPTKKKPAGNNAKKDAPAKQGVPSNERQDRRRK